LIVRDAAKINAATPTLSVDLPAPAVDDIDVPLVRSFTKQFSEEPRDDQHFFLSH